MVDRPKADASGARTEFGATDIGTTRLETSEWGATQVAGTPVGRGPETEAPRKIGRFAVLRLLGAGGMGVVYAGYDEELDRRVAIKLLQTRAGAETSQGHTRLLREAQAMAKLSHPNIATVYEVGLWNGQVFMAMEFVAGKSLGEWLAAAQRFWREVLEVYLQAGRGLAAAHASGLVHRDFKPDNAIIGDDGRVRVLDFGLARATSEVTQERPVVTAAVSEALTSSVLSAPLTMTGAVLGTPAYMAPEQHRGEAADARSDQFSFCVSLYEALYGQRPFAGDDLVGLIYNVLAGEVRPPPRERRVPGKVHAAIVRGLANEPGERWPDMPALLDALTLDPARKRRLIGAGVAALVVAGVVGGLELRALGAGRCGGAQAQIEGAWNDDRRAAVGTALLATELPYAADTVTRVRQGLDEYAAAWVAGHRDACEATVVRQEQSEAVRDERMLCLAQRRQQFEALVDVLARADKTVVIGAVEAVRSLPGVEACADVRYLAAGVKPPEEAAGALQMHALQQGLAQVRANSSAGRYREAEAMLRPISEAAERLAHTPLLVQVARERAALLQALGRYAEAETVAEQAYFEARVTGLESDAGDLAGKLIRIVGGDLVRPVEGLIWAKHAFAAQRRLGDPAVEASLLRARATLRIKQSELDSAALDLQRAFELDEQRPTPDPLELESAARALGSLREHQGKHAEAEALLRRALELRAGVLGPEHPTMAELHELHGGSLAWLGRDEEALVELKRALAMHTRDGGPDHPWVGTDLQKIGSVLQSQGHLREGLGYQQRALVVHRKALGGDHATVAVVHNGIGTTLAKLGRDAEAREHFQRALEIYRATLGESHADVAKLYVNLGVLHKKAGDLDGAAAYYARAMTLLERRLGLEHPALGQLHFNVGNLRVLQGRKGEAREEFQRSLKILEAALGTSHSTLSTLLVGISDLARAQGELDVALAYAERALALFKDGEEPDPRLLAQARFCVAQALWTLRQDPGRARTLARQARDAYVIVGADVTKELAEVEAWLAGQR